MIPLIDGDMILFRGGLSVKEGSPWRVYKSRCDMMMENLIDHLGVGEAYLTSGGNYRKLVPTYKSNRPKGDLPDWFNDLKNYLINEYNFKQCYGFEADDAMGIVQSTFPGKTIICTTDKDLDQITGWHYNFRTKEKYHVDEDQGQLFYHQQFLLGDVADNIKGVTGLGPVKTKKLLNLELSPAERWKIIEEKYREEYGLYEWQNKLDENKLLLRICRSIEELSRVITPDIGQINLQDLLTPRTLDLLTA